MADLKPDLRERVKALILSMVPEQQLDAITIDVRDDESGDEAIFIKLSYKLSAEDFDPALIIKMRSAVRLLLVQNDDERFPYIRHGLKDGQGIKAA